MFAILELTVTLGNVLSILVTILTAVVAAWKISLVLAQLKWRVDLMWKDYKTKHNINGRTHEDNE